MLRANFLYKFFKSKPNRNHEIIKYNSTEKFNIQDEINTNIIEVDKNIKENSKALLEAQVVKFKYTFSKSNNFIEEIGKNVYKKKLEESISWHQTELQKLYSTRRELQINLEKIKGIFWLNRIKRFLKITLIGFLILLSVLVFLSGFMIIIYLLPLFIIIFLLHSLTSKKF